MPGHPAAMEIYDHRPRGGQRPLPMRVNASRTLVRTRDRTALAPDQVAVTDHTRKGEGSPVSRAGVVVTWTGFCWRIRNLSHKSELHYRPWGYVADEIIAPQDPPAEVEHARIQLRWMVGPTLVAWFLLEPQSDDLQVDIGIPPRNGGDAGDDQEPTYSQAAEIHHTMKQELESDPSLWQTLIATYGDHCMWPPLERTREWSQDEAAATFRVGRATISRKLSRLAEIAHDHGYPYPRHTPHGFDAAGNDVRGRNNTLYDAGLLQWLASYHLLPYGKVNTFLNRHRDHPGTRYVDERTVIAVPLTPDPTAPIEIVIEADRRRPASRS